MHIIHREYAYIMQGTCIAFTMHVPCMEYTSAMHGICLYHAWNCAWYMHEDLGKMHACFRHVLFLSSTCKCPNSLYVPVLSHETCMIHAHYALQDQAISIHEITRDLVHGMC